MFCTSGFYEYVPEKDFQLNLPVTEFAAQHPNVPQKYSTNLWEFEIMRDCKISFAAVLCYAACFSPQLNHFAIMRRSVDMSMLLLILCIARRGDAGK